MALPIEIDKLTAEQKWDLLEALWADICRDPGAWQPPAWHGQVLAEREAAEARGEAEYVDWEQAKRRIREAGA